VRAVLAARREQRILRARLGSIHQGDASALDHRRPFLPLGERSGFFAIGVHSREFLAVTIKNRHLPVLVFPAPVFGKRQFRAGLLHVFSDFSFPSRDPDISTISILNGRTQVQSK